MRFSPLPPAARRLPGVALFTALLLAAVAAGRGAEPPALLFLRNDRVELGLLPAAGGRAVLLRRPGEANLLSTAFPPSEFVVRDLSAPLTPEILDAWRELGGHAVWLGPQSEWWNQQDLLPARRGADWPPDPWSVEGIYEVLEQTATRVQLRGPASPVWGVQMFKDYEVNDAGTVRVSVRARNVSATPKRWGLWTNTRLPGRACGFVAPDFSRPDVLAFPKAFPSERCDVPLTFFRGWLGMRPTDAPAATGGGAKVLVWPARPWLAAFLGNRLFVKRAVTTPFPAGPIAPGQGAVEMFGAVSPEDPGGSILELEMHGPCVDLPPGGELEFTETWEILAHDGGDSLEAQTRRLEALDGPSERRP